MPNDIGIQSVQPISIGSDAAETRAAPYFQPPVAEQPVSAPAIANPSLRLDPALGLVVLQFHSDTGAPTTSIPSERQLEAYQRWTQTRIGTPPAGMGVASDSQAAVGGGAASASRATAGTAIVAGAVPAAPAVGAADGLPPDGLPMQMAGAASQDGGAPSVGSGYSPSP
jgi:hypothetical protein